MTSDRALRSLEAVLPAGTCVTVVDREKQDTVVKVAGQTLRVRWLPVGWPRQVGGALHGTPRPDVIATPRLSPRSLAARKAAELALVRVIHHYGGQPEFVLLGGLVPSLLCAQSGVRHAGTTDVDVQVNLEISSGGRQRYAA